jgi:hypothetical protein
MSSIQIPNLPAAIGLSGSEQLECVQSGTSVRVTSAQIQTYVISPAGDYADDAAAAAGGVAVGGLYRNGSILMIRVA